MNKPKLSSLPAPALAGVVTEKNVRAAIAEMRNCQYDGADMIDLHLPFLASSAVEDLKTILAATPLPVLALNYSAEKDEDERIASLWRAVEAGADGIDMQGYTFHRPSKTGFFGEDRYSFTKNNPKEVVTDPAIIAKQCDLIERVHAAGAEVLLSCHPGIPMKSETITELALFLEQRKPDIIKIVTVAKEEADLSESIRAMLMLKKEVKTPIAYHANGIPGIPSRIINPLLGGQIAFCVDRCVENSTNEQVDLRTAAAIVQNMRKVR